MSKKAFLLAFAICCLSVTAISQTSAPTTPRSRSKPEHFRAVASYPRAATRTAWADVRITRYSSDATTKRLAALLVEGGQDALVKALEELEPIGKAQLTGRVGFFDLKLIRS